MTRLYSIDAHKPTSVVHFDWLTAVIDVPSAMGRNGLTIEEWVTSKFEQLGVKYDEWSEGHGLYTYEFSKSTANASIIMAWPDVPDEIDNSTVRDIVGDAMLQLSGAGVESLESVLDNNGLKIADFVKGVDACSGGHFSRVDACCNFFNYPKELSARYVGEEALAGHLVTRSSSIRLVRRASSTGGRDDDEAYQGVAEGYTTYVGKSPKQLRIYNKLAERSDKVNLRFNVDSWSRWEFQLNGEHAEQFIKAYLKDGCDLPTTWTAFLAGSYRWIEEVGHQEKRSRYPNATWFQKLIDGSYHLKTRAEHQRPTFERSEHWLKHQVSGTLATVYLTRYKKYLLNGVPPEDARKMAIKYLMRDIDDKVLNDDVNLTTVDAWLKERGLN